MRVGTKRCKICKVKLTPGSIGPDYQRHIETHLYPFICHELVEMVFVRAFIDV